MKRVRSLLATLALIATLIYTPVSILSSLIAILVFLVIGLAVIVGLRTQNSTINSLAFFGIGLAIVSIIGGILVIFQIVHEKRTNKPDDTDVTTVTKSVAGRIRITEGPVTIEAPDAESAIKMLQVIINSISSLKVESGLTIEVKEPEERDAPETKRDEE